VSVLIQTFFDATNAKHTSPNLRPEVRHAFTDNGGGHFSNAVCWTKCHFTGLAVSFLE